MSNQDSGAEKSFDATPQRLEDARKKGEIARSTDLNTAAAYAGALLFLAQFAGPQLGALGASGAHLFADADGLAARFLSGTDSGLVGDYMSTVVLSVGLLFLIPAICVLGSLIAQQAIVVAPKRIEPKLSRLSVLSNAKQKFGLTGIVEFAKSFAKMMIFGATLVWFLTSNLDRLVALVFLSPAQILLELGRMLTAFLTLVLMISVAIGAIDYLWQTFDHLRKHKMTRQEVLDETKQSEGDPHMKGKRRQKAQAIAMNQMLQDVQDASVIVVNPTHYAVALKWSPGDPTPPICVAKGIDEVAARIREVAAEHGVPIRRDPPTARAIHASVEVGAPIDRAQFAAVAAAIRFADDMRVKARGRPWSGKNN